MGVKHAYEALLAEGRIAPDPGQAAGIAALSRLETEVAEAGEGGFSLFHRRRPRAVRGVYLYGPVGRGKSMLMDLFAREAPPARTRRAHFHAFMAEVHRDVDLWRRGDPAAKKARFGHAKGDDPIPPVADRIAGEARLLCFDELQVTDIADAMILGRLFEALFARGVTLVCTSNRAPTELYKDGLNRQLFLPFIAMLQERCEVVEVAGAVDHRLKRLREADRYLHPITPATTAAFDGLWARQLDGAAETGAELEVLGRRLSFPRAAGGLLRAGFAELCGRPLGPQDYLAVAAAFPTVFLDGAPVLGPEKRDQAARFRTLVDALYEARTRLVVLAAAEPEGLYAAGDQSFEFQRTASRLEEMRADDWLAERPAVAPA